MTIGERVARGHLRSQRPGNHAPAWTAAVGLPFGRVMRRVSRLVTRLLVLGIGLGLAGCTRTPAKTAAPPPLSVSVSLPVEREVRDHADYTARTAAVESVEVRAHVWGYLQKVHFKEGDLVKAGDLLFEIDPRPYEALLNQAKAKVRQDTAQLAYEEVEFLRSQNLFSRQAVSSSEMDKARASRDVARANLEADKALVESRQLDLDYTKITAPVAGRTSRYVVTVGNLIQAGDQNGGTLLTTIVSVDPMYAYFDSDEHTALRVRQLVRDGKSDSPRAGGYPISLGMPNEEGFPHVGTITFVENQVNAKTGTLRLRGTFPNKDLFLIPGFFGRVRVPIGRPHKAVLVSDRALDTDQGQKVLYVVGEANKVERRPVVVGALHDRLREIADGLKPGERVVVTGLQQLRPGITVEPKVVDMPGAGGKRTTE
jgi:RND family efflux transporter MFP subunit